MSPKLQLDPPNLVNIALFDEAASDPLDNHKTQRIADDGQVTGLREEKKGLHSHTISTTTFERYDPWRHISTRNLNAGGEGC